MDYFIYLRYFEGNLKMSIDELARRVHEFKRTDVICLDNGMIDCFAIGANSGKIKVKKLTNTRLGNTVVVSLARPLFSAFSSGAVRCFLVVPGCKAETFLGLTVKRPVEGAWSKYKNKALQLVTVP